MLLRLGSRDSPLAIIQAKEAMRHILSVNHETTFELITTQTTGDLSHAPFRQINQSNVFTKEIEDMLLQNKIDIAIHSVKDMPAAENAELEIASAFISADYRDCLVSKVKYNSIAELPIGCRVGTASARRKAQLLRLRPDLNVVHIRGNVMTRIKKMHSSDIDAIILATAGLSRLNVTTENMTPIPVEDMLPSAGQGVVAAQIRSNNQAVGNILKDTRHPQTWMRIQTERKFLDIMCASCNDPVAALALVESNIIKARFMIMSPDGSLCYETTQEGGDYLDVAIRGADALMRYRYIWKSN